jgi:stage II sporulation protein R
MGVTMLAGVRALGLRLAAIILAGAVLWAPAASAKATAVRPPDVLRFRVIANSDNPWDQAVKNAVRDAVLARLDPVLAHVRTEAAAERAVRRHLGTVRAAVAAVLRADRATYGARVTLGTTLFPPKAYGTWLLPGGRYHALVIRLGRGAGHNWWCILFPTLCFVDMGAGLAVPAAATTAPDRARVVRPRVVWWLPVWLVRWWARL